MCDHPEGDHRQEDDAGLSLVREPSSILDLGSGARARDDCDRLTKEIADLLGVKENIEEIQKAVEDLKVEKEGLEVEVVDFKMKRDANKDDIDLAKRWIGFIMDPISLDNRDLDKFVGEVVALRQWRTGRGVKRVIGSNGTVLCECNVPWVSIGAPRDISEERVRRRMAELHLPLVEDEFMARNEHESARA